MRRWRWGGRVASPSPPSVPFRGNDGKVNQATDFMTSVPEAKPSSGGERAKQVRRIFSEIAPRYDLINHVLSLNIDRRWRGKAISELGWERRPKGTYLDACAGTFDLSLELASRPGFDGHVMASDFAQPMLVQGRGKLNRTPISPVCGDTLRLPFPDASFDGASVGFGVRNLADLERGLADMRRVLRPGAHLVVLEFSVPTNIVMKTFYMTYFTRILPIVGRLISGHPWAYTYLPESVKEFPNPAGLAALMEGAGFVDVRWKTLSGGIAALHVGVAP